MRLIGRNDLFLLLGLTLPLFAVFPGPFGRVLDDAHQIIGRAATALDSAKDDGRNCARVAELPAAV